MRTEYFTVLPMGSSISPLLDQWECSHFEINQSRPNLPTILSGRMNSLAAGALFPIALDFFVLSPTAMAATFFFLSSFLIPCITYDRVGHKHRRRHRASNSGVVPLTLPQQDNILATSKNMRVARSSQSEGSIYVKALDAIAIQSEARAADATL